MRSCLTALILAALLPLTSCATRTDLALMRAEARIAELEKYIAGAHDDMGLLMRSNIELQGEILMWQRGAEWQARQMAQIRETCQL